jgi:hypothetical protein
VQAKEAAVVDASKLAELTAYVDVIISRMHDTEEDSAERKKNVAEQERALLRLKRVMEARLRSESSLADALAFDARIDEPSGVGGLAGEAKVPTLDACMDDNETLLRLMHAVDSNHDGAISEPEMLGSKELTAEMGKALRALFACNLEAVEEALAQVNAEDFGGYRRGQASGFSGGAIDRKASVKALFAALDPSAAASGWVEKSSLVSFAMGLNEEKLASALTGLASTLLAADAELDFLAVKRAAQRVPRVKGPRVDWAKGLGLDMALARQLPPGTLEDGLAGVRGMPSEEAKQAVDAFLEDARVKIYTALVQAKTEKGSKSAAEANSKFEGFQGSFASLKEFHAGAEASLKLGYPNPDTMRGILNEHTKHPSATRLFCTSNYRIVTCLLVEYAWAVLEAGPGDPPMVRAQLDRARKLIREIVKERNGVETADDQLLFPGEVGDCFAESLVMLTFPGVSADSANARAIGDHAKGVAVKLLATAEERARGVAILDHKACAERISNGTGALLHKPSGKAAADDGSLCVGVLLPMSSIRAEAIHDQLWAGVKAAGGAEVKTVVADKAMERRWTFSRFTSAKELRKWLEERSLADLRKVLADDGNGKEWAHVDPADGRWAHDDAAAYKSLCDAMVLSFVRTELQADLRSALESSGASDLEAKALLGLWDMEAVESLDTEEKWGKAEGWVRLHQGRIQGRTRLGLRALMAREKDKIERFGLTESEVLGAHIYTGANFVPLNGICRSFPPSILELLEGNNTTPDNKMCTTLFCISSCLKKLSQNTELPESRYNPSGTRAERTSKPEMLKPGSDYSSPRPDLLSILMPSTSLQEGLSWFGFHATSGAVLGAPRQPGLEGWCRAGPHVHHGGQGRGAALRQRQGHRGRDRRGPHPDRGRRLLPLHGPNPPPLPLPPVIPLPFVHAAFALRQHRPSNANPPPHQCSTVHSAARNPLATRGACAGQYPGEKEITFPPFTCLESHGDARLERDAKGNEVVIFPLKVPGAPPHLHPHPTLPL